MSLHAMNWYYEKEGVSHGPCPEAEIMTLVQRKQVLATTLVWHPGLDGWDMVQVVKPEWLERAEAAPVLEAPARQTVPRTEGPLPSAETAPASVLRKPKAGLEKSGEGEKAKGGILGRLFGMGKKK